MCHIPTYLKQLNLGESNISHQTPPSANLAGFAYYKKTCTFQKWRPKNAKQKRFTVPSPSLVSEGIRASKQSRNLHDLHWQPGVESAFRNYSNILSSVKYHGFTMNIYELSSLKTNMTMECWPMLPVVGVSWSIYNHTDHTVFSWYSHTDIKA